MSETYDVVVLGSGVSGLAAALAAHEYGLKAIVVEKDKLLGGQTATSYGLVWVGNNHLMRAAGLIDSRDDVIQYMSYLGGGELSIDRMETFVDRAPEAIHFFSECGIPFRIATSVVDHYYGTVPSARKSGRSLECELIEGSELADWSDRIRTPTGAPYYMTTEELVSWGGINRHNSWDQEIVRNRKERDVRGKGVGIVSQFVKALAGRNIPIVLNDGGERLIVDGERVVGVVTSSGRRIRATRGVVIATGSYERNPELMRDFDSLPFHNPLSLPSLTGDGLIMGAEIGGAIRRLQNSLTIMLGFVLIPDDPAQDPTPCMSGISEMCSPHTMVVNRTGSRFADESYFQSVIPEITRFDVSTHDHLNLPCYLIFDRQYTEKYAFAHLPAGAEIPKSIPRSDNIKELAVKLGVDPGGLTSTVRRFNEFAKIGRDADYGRGEREWALAANEAQLQNRSLGSIEQPPFYGVQLHPTMNSGSAGLLSNIHGQVIHQRRRPIPGLYVSGVASARTDMGTGYQAGLNLASGITFSWLAARDMAGRN